MNRLAGTFPVILLAACAPQPLNIDKQAVDDYVETAELPAAEVVRTKHTDKWHSLNKHYVLYSTSKGDFLIHFARPCWELETHQIVADKRWGSEMRPRFDTLRGCPIDQIYIITEAQALELDRLSDAPGSKHN